MNIFFSKTLVSFEYTTRLASSVLFSQCFLKFIYAEEYLRYMLKAVVEIVFIIQQQNRRSKGLLFKLKHLEIGYQLYSTMSTIQYRTINNILR